MAAGWAADGLDILDSFGDQILLGKIAHLAVQLDFIARHLARVFDADVVVAKLERFDKGDGFLVDFAISDGRVIGSVLGDANGTPVRLVPSALNS